MKGESADHQTESTESPWPKVLRIAGEEFQQSFSVAQLAVKLCELKVTQSKIPLEKGNVAPEKFLEEAWKLIESAREHVLREQSNDEYLMEHGESNEAAVKLLGRNHRESCVPFEKLCNPERNQGDTEMIYGVEWKVYRSEREFYDLFQAYWRYIGEQWKRGDRDIGTVEELDTQGKPTRVNLYSEAERDEMAARARDTGSWEKGGKALFDSWKTNGVSPVDFLAIASGYFDFERGVKFITGENQFDRALPWFRRFLKSRFADETMAETAIAEYREKRFAAPQKVDSLKNEFAKWKREEKSRNASQARGKRGRVRSASDNRLGGRPPSLT